jgi:hypothetical protein
MSLLCLPRDVLFSICLHLSIEEVGRLLLSCKTLKDSLDAESFQGRLANQFFNALNHDHCCDLQCLEELKKLSGAEKFRLFRENYLLQVRSDTGLVLGEVQREKPTVTYDAQYHILIPRSCTVSEMIQKCFTFEKSDKMAKFMRAYSSRRKQKVMLDDQKRGLVLLKTMQQCRFNVKLFIVS